MSVVRSWLSWCVSCLLAAGFAAGCGSSDTAPNAGNEGSKGLVTVSIGAPRPADAADPDDDDDDKPDPDDEQDDKAEIVVPKAGTPEFLVRESTKLLLEPPPKTEDVEVLKKHRKERNDKIIKLSQQAIEQTHSDKEKERLFNVAVHNLLEARLQNALTGDPESIELLYDDAAALLKRDPKSHAAAEGAHTLVNHAYGMALNATSDKQRWIADFADLAQHFAKDFRSEERRSLPLLFSAGRSCELAGLRAEALDCYTLIQKEFPQSAHAARVAPIVKRLKLTGKPAQLSGPTIDGDQIAVDDLLGKAVLVVFWSAEVKPFLEQLPKILEVTRKQSRRGLFVVGVNLDLEAGTVEDFLVKHKINWPQIFFPEDEKRGWNNPLVVNYGIMDLPALWLIDQSGNVVSTNVKIESLAAEVGKLLDGEAAAGASGSAAKSAADLKAPAEKPEETILERPKQRQAKRPTAVGE